RSGILVAADRLLLERDLHAVPVLECYADAADDDIAAPTHPIRPLAADPDRLCHRLGVGDRGVVGAGPEAHQVTGRLLAPKARDEAGLRPSQLCGVVGEPGKLANGM